MQQDLSILLKLFKIFTFIIFQNPNLENKQDAKVGKKGIEN